MLTQSMAVASQQYMAVAEMLLTLFNPSPAGGHLGRADLAFAEDRALRICGLAQTNDDVSAKVNAFGPLAFCKRTFVGWASNGEISNMEAGGRYLTHENHRNALTALLIDSSVATAWPVHFILQDLRDCWECG